MKLKKFFMAAAVFAAAIILGCSSNKEDEPFEGGAKCPIINMAARLSYDEPTDRYIITIDDRTRSLLVDSVLGRYNDFADRIETGDTLYVEKPSPYDEVYPSLSNYVGKSFSTTLSAHQIREGDSIYPNSLKVYLYEIADSTAPSYTSIIYLIY